MEDRDKIEIVNEKMEEIMNKYEKLYQDVLEEGFIEGFHFPDLAVPPIRMTMPDPIPNFTIPGGIIMQGFDIPIPSVNDIFEPIKNAFKPVTDFFDNIKKLFDNIGKGLQILEKAWKIYSKEYL